MTNGVRGSSRWYYWKTWSGINRTKGSNHYLPNYYDMWSLKRTNPRLDPWSGEIEPFLSPLTWSACATLYPTVVRQQQNKVVERLVNMVNQQQYLADLYEAKSAVDLVALQLRRVLSLTRRLKKLPSSLLKFKGKKGASLVFKPKRIRGRGNLKNIKKPPNTDLSGVPALWLEYWFAVMPTVGSINGLADTFDVPLGFNQFRLTTPASNIKVKGVTSGFYDVSCVARGYMRMVNPNVGILDRMGLRNVFSTVWEVAPWSWAVDYFANVGQLFANLDGLFKNVEWWATSVTHRVTGELETIWDKYPSPPTKQVERMSNYSVFRTPGVPTVFVPEFLLGPGLKQISYLGSAIALTLKGKMS